MEKRTWQYYSLRFLGRLICLFPYSWILFCGAILGRIAYYLSGRHRDRGIEHVRKALGYSDEEAKALIYDMYRNLGRSTLEVLYTPKLVANHQLMKEIIDYEADPAFDEYLKTGKGGMFITGHYGNWEWLAMRIAIEGVDAGTVVKYQPQPWVNAWLNDNRRSLGIAVYPRTAGGGEILQGIRAIKKGKYFSLFCDQDGGKEGIISTFLGRPSSNLMGPGLIASKVKVPIFPVFIWRRPEGGHLVRVEAPLPVGTDPKDINQQIQAAIETQILKKPNEWLWLQRRWNTVVSEEGADE